MSGPKHQRFRIYLHNIRNDIGKESDLYMSLTCPANSSSKIESFAYINQKGFCTGAYLVTGSILNLGKEP
jgi:hypothetical protein